MAEASGSRNAEFRMTVTHFQECPVCDWKCRAEAWTEKVTYGDVEGKPRCKVLPQLSRGLSPGEGPWLWDERKKVEERQGRGGQSPSNGRGWGSRDQGEGT